MQPTPAPAVSVRGLTKSFAGRMVLDDIDLEVPRGTVFGLLGPNGAGKTTTVRILATLARAEAGTIRVCGHDPAEQPAAVRKCIGVTGQFAAVDEMLTGAENLRLVGRLQHLKRPEIDRRTTDLLDRFGLSEAAARRAGTYSGGMRRRLDLAMSLLGDPSVVFLDEPTTGLDPRSRRELWVTVRELVATGVTVFLTTQYLEEADQLADRIAVLNNGRIVAEGTPAELKRLVPGGHVRVGFADVVALRHAAAVLPAAEVDPDELALRISVGGTTADLHELLGRFADHGVAVGDLSIHTPDLDDVFFALTGPADRKVSLS